MGEASGMIQNSRISRESGSERNAAIAADVQQRRVLPGEPRVATRAYRPELDFSPGWRRAPVRNWNCWRVQVPSRYLVFSHSRRSREKLNLAIFPSGRTRAQIRSWGQPPEAEQNWLFGRRDFRSRCVGSFESRGG